MSNLLKFMVFFLVSTGVCATEYSAASKIHEIRTCFDSGTFYYIVELDNGFRVFNYVGAIKDNEREYRANNLMMVVAAFHAESKVILARYNNGQTKCGIGSLGELEGVVSNSAF